MNSILIVDDNELVLKAVCRQLERHAGEWHVSSAQSGVEALRLFRARPFDLVITDILMPEQDGFGTIAEVRKLRPGTRIIAMSGGGERAGTDFLRVARVLGANEVLHKPFSLETLIGTVRRVLGTEAPGAALPRAPEAPSASQLP